MKRQKRILVVDDDLGVRKMLARVLVDEGYCVQTAAEGDKALEIAQSSAPDLVLLDVKLRRESGLGRFPPSRPGQAPATGGHHYCQAQSVFHGCRSRCGRASGKAPPPP